MNTAEEKKPRETRKRPLIPIRRILVGGRAFATVDEGDYERLSIYEWKLNKAGYAYRIEKTAGRTRIIFMHRQIMEEELAWRKGRWEIHHDNEVKLDNRRRNLLVCDPRWHGGRHRPSSK